MGKFTSAEEWQLKLQETLGEDIGKLYYHLVGEILDLNKEWYTYKVLFIESEENVETLNTFSPYIFYKLQKTLRTDVILYLSRLTDPAQSKQFENASLKKLIELVAENTQYYNLSREINSQFSWIIDKLLPPLRNIRNKFVSHQDFDSILDQKAIQDPLTNELIGLLVSSINDLMNTIQKECFNSTMAYDPMYVPGGPDQLLANIRTWQKARTYINKLRSNGEPLPPEFDIGDG